MKKPRKQPATTLASGRTRKLVYYDMLMDPDAKSMRGASRRLHNRRICMLITPEGEYQMHFYRVLPIGEADRMRAAGHVDTVDNQIIRNRIWFSVVQLTAEAFNTIVELREEVDQRRKRKL